MLQQFKRLFLKLPGIRRLDAQRETLAAECSRLRGEVDAQRGALEAVTGQRDEHRHALEVIGGELDQRKHALEVVVAERDELKQHCARLDGERSSAEQRCSELGAALETVQQELARLERRQGFAPPGHFYSPIPDLEEIADRQDEIFGELPESIPGVDLRADEQLALLRRFAELYADLPFAPQPTEGLRYHYENPAYSYSDAIMLHCMIRHLQPRRIIEIGSGYSSCAMLDTNDRFFDGSIEMTFIEPYPQLLHDLLKPGDSDAVRIIDRPVQDVPGEIFGALGKNDILFVDSTHVSKIGSDVNHIFFDVLPHLNEGVHIHVHDIGYPFEYPKEWVFEGRAWNEAYLLRSFLSFNPHFRVLLMNTFMHHFHRDFFDQHMPLCTRNPGGSIWMRKETAAER